MVSVFAANRGWGLSKDYAKDPNAEKVPFSQVAKALAPLGMLIGMLVVTRIKQLGIKGLLTSKEEWFSFQLPFDLSKITRQRLPDHHLRQHLRPRRKRFLPNPSTFRLGFRLSSPFGFASCCTKPNSKMRGLSMLQPSTKPKNLCLP